MFVITEFHCTSNVCFVSVGLDNGDDSSYSKKHGGRFERIREYSVFALKIASLLFSPCLRFFFKHEESKQNKEKRKFEENIF
jgi:hypothetical protein